MPDFLKTPETFWVEEIPAYAPRGEGEHVYLKIRMAGRSTASLLRHLRREIPVGALGYAGLKDRQATVVQWISIHREVLPRARRILEHLGVEVLESRAHPHKLRPGKLRANRFRIRIAPPPDRLIRVLTEGFPNRYGPQRFGKDNLSQARVLVEALMEGRRVRRTFRTRFLLSVFQAYLFNRMVDLRMRRGWLRRVLPGDWVVRRPGGRPWLWEGDPVPVHLTRIPTHPLVGRKVPLARGEPGAIERAVLREEGLGEDGTGIPERGTRRNVLVFPEEAYVRGGWLEVVLPPGSYATVLIETLGYRVMEG